MTKAQSTFSNAFKMAERENGPVNTWDIGVYGDNESAKKLRSMIVPYLKTQKICDKNIDCFGDYYKNLQGSNYGASLIDNNSNFASALLEDGSSVYFYSYGSGCQNPNVFSNSCGAIGIDINGPKPPNRAGIDLFEFLIWSPEGVLPNGKNDTGLNNCQHSGTGAMNGYRCTAWVLYKKNMDYTFRDISWDE